MGTRSARACNVIIIIIKYPPATSATATNAHTRLAGWVLFTIFDTECVCVCKVRRKERMPSACACDARPRFNKNKLVRLIIMGHHHHHRPCVCDVRVRLSHACVHHMSHILTHINVCVCVCVHKQNNKNHSQIIQRISHTYVAFMYTTAARVCVCVCEY